MKFQHEADSMLIWLWLKHISLFISQ